jgi:hypothetical protein
MQKYERLLQWAAAEGTQPAVAVVADPYGGRCLRATQDVAPGGVLLSVPMTRVFASKVGTQSFTCKVTRAPASRMLLANSGRCSKGHVLTQHEASVSVP